MDIREYQERSMRTFTMGDKNTAILNCCIGLHGETGEVSDIVKKNIFQGHKLDVEHIKEELGDVMFYIVNLANVLDLNMEGILQGNVDKLLKRYPNGFNATDSVNR